MSSNMSSKRIAVSAFYATVGLALSIALNADCHFVTRSIVGVPQDATNTQSIGLWQWEPLPGTCLPYKLCQTEVCIQPDFDTAFNSAKSFAVITPLFGSVGTVVLWVAVFKQFKIMWLFVPFLVVCLFQGFTLLVFSSNICASVGHTNYFNILNSTYATNNQSMPIDGTSISNFITDGTPVICANDSGSKMAISATVMWFLTALTCFRNEKKTDS